MVFHRGDPDPPSGRRRPAAQNGHIPSYPAVASAAQRMS